MIELFANGEPITTETLTALKTTETVNKAGTMLIGLPPGHRARDAILAPQTVLTLKEDGETQFRGRVLTPQRQNDLQDQITCEGELAFLQDTVVRGAMASLSDADQMIRILTTMHNGMVDPARQFTVGSIDAALSGIPSDLHYDDSFVSVYQVLSDCAAAFDVFLTAQDGVLSVCRPQSGIREIRWGKNLISIQHTENRGDLCTVLYAEGSGEGGTHYTLSQIVGRDYITATEAAEKYGRIAKYVHFSGCVSAEDLLDKAENWLTAHCTPNASERIMAFDLHWKDDTVPRFRAGDRVHVISPPHGYENFLTLTSVTCDWLHPSANTINIGLQRRLV
jgi:hypothetical protein